jgi:hypothetical protein
MSRGWESKDVASQMADGRRVHDRREPPTAGERARWQRTSGLQLSRAHVLHELEVTRAAVRRAALEDALRLLDEQLAALPEPDR